MEKVRVQLDHRAEPAEVEAVRAAFADAGVPAAVEGGYEKARPGEAWGEGDEPEWHVLIYVAAISGFLGSFFGAAGEDAWKALKALAERLRDSRKKNPPYQGTVELRESERDRSGLQVIAGWAYDLEVSDDAWQTLLELDWVGLPESEWMIIQWFEVDKTWHAFEPSLTREGAELYWDRTSKHWREGSPPAPD